MASRISELNDPKNGSPAVAKLRETPSRMPASAARNAETQNTVTRAAFVPRPSDETLTGESARPRSMRPSRLRWMATTATAATTTATSTR